MTEKQSLKRHPLALAVFAALNLIPVAHAVSPNVVISQVYGGGGNASATLRNDYIELFNRGATPVSLAGMSVQYASSAGSTWTNKTDLPSVTLQPGQYFLVQEASGGAVGSLLPTADVTGTINMSGSAGKVALVSNTTALAGACPTTNVVDFIGYGPATTCSETSPTSANLSSILAAVRNSNGCTDTDSNLADFTNATPAARNTASSTNPCGSSSTNVSINDVSITEGNSGTTTLTFTVTRTDNTGAFSVDYATLDGTATTADSDYVAASNTLSFTAGGVLAQTVSVTVNGDGVIEPNETLSVNLSNLVNTAGTASIIDNQGLGTITNDDVAACGDPATLISAVQGTGATTPLSGQAGTSIEGIVVGDYQGANGLKGFFVQEEDADADANPATSEGVFIYEDATTLASVNVGDKVRVIGTPGEAFGTTQLSTLTSIQVCNTGNTIPTISALTLPVPNVPNGNLVTATAAIDSYYEPFEGMLVKYPANLKVSEYFELERFGQLVLSQGGRIPTFTNVSNPSAAGYINHQIKLAKRQIVLDDSNDIQNFYSTNNAALPYPTGGLSTTNRFRGGDTIKNLTGVLQYSFSQWRLRPVEELVDYTFVSANPRKPASPSVGGDVKVASFNVLNFFTTVDTTASNNTGDCLGGLDCRGADSAAELTRQTDKAAVALCGIDADIVGLMEIENNATASLSALTAAVNGVSGCGPYEFINTGIIGSDAIKVGLLYKTAAVTPVGSYQLLTSSVDPRFIDDKNRPTLAQTFEVTDSFSPSFNGKLTVAVNHLKSKGSACTGTFFSSVEDIDNSDGQGNCNLTRKNAAMALVDWLATDPTTSGDTDYLVIGDLNSYAKEDPIKAIEKGSNDVVGGGDDYTNLVKHFGGNAAYSYVFDGQTGYLDHGLASASLLSQVNDATDWHINSDEPPSFDYNDDVLDAGEAAFEKKTSVGPLYAADQYRTSDHDPVIIGLHLNADVNIINGTVARETLVGGAANDRITGFGGADTLTGGSGNDEFVYTATTEGIDIITDFEFVLPGLSKDFESTFRGATQDKIDLAALLLTLGYQGNDPIADGVVVLVGSGSNAIVYIDPDGTAGLAAKRALVKVLGVSAVDLSNPANFKF